MTTQYKETSPVEIFNFLFDYDLPTITDRSFYFNSDDDKKIVRISNHKANSSNFITENEGVEQIYMVFVNANLSEREMQKHCEAIEYSLDLEYTIEYCNIGNEVIAGEYEYLKMSVNLFLQD